MRPLRIAVVSDGDPRSIRTNSGVAAGILAALERRSDVEVIVTVDSTPHRLVSLAIGLVSVRFPISAWRNQKRKGRAATKARSRVRDRALSRLAEEPDVVLHVRNTYFPAKRPYVVFIDGTASLSQRYWPAWALPKRDYQTRIGLEKAFFGSAVLVATAGRYVVDEIVGYYGQDSRKVVAIGGGTNLAPESDPPGGRADQSSDQVTFLFVGREFERKGGPELVDAFAKVHATRPNAQLKIVGPTQFGIEVPGVEWLGAVEDRARMRELYLAADVFCLLSHHEPYGLAVQEALASGLPCIVSDRGALSEIAGDAGIVVDPSSEAQVVEALTRLVDEPSLRLLLAQNAPSQLRGLSWDHVADRLVRALEERLD